jgi:putative transposase
VIREAVKAVAAELMELEVSELIGAEHGERRPDDRATHRNGYRRRRWDTRAGEIELQIPKIRQGSYFPSILEPRRRSEQALLAVVQQAYVCGVSTRRVDQLVESLGLRISKSEVSRVCQALDEHVQAFRTRPLEGRYPYLFLDAKVRHEALSDRAGCETPLPGCRSGPVKLRAACPRSCGERVGAALTTTRRAGTVGPCGRGKRDGSA